MNEKKIRIGLLRETKKPMDNRVVLTPQQAAGLMLSLPDLEIIIQPSTSRVYNDEEYRRCGVEVKEDMSTCDYLFGVKEVDIDALLESKHYFFFGHIGKKQPYNAPLKQAMIYKSITFTDYEYLRIGGKRVCAFGWEAGVVGTYNTVRMYGEKYGLYHLPPFVNGTVWHMKENLNKVKHALRRCDVKILITGNGKVAKGARYILDYLQIPRVRAKEYKEQEKTCYSVAKHSILLQDEEGHYDKAKAANYPEKYHSLFPEFATTTDILIACHFWDNMQPKYLTKDILNTDNRIKCVGDITCDINGSIETTIRPSTHDEPFYDVTPYLEEAPLFLDKENISVMAVDNLPNALAKEASQHFGEQLLKSGLFETLVLRRKRKMVTDATIIEYGEITEPFSYLRESVSK